MPFSEFFLDFYALGLRKVLNVIDELFTSWILYHFLFVVIHTHIHFSWSEFFIDDLFDLHSKFNLINLTEIEIIIILEKLKIVLNDVESCGSCS